MCDPLLPTLYQLRMGRVVSRLEIKIDHNNNIYTVVFLHFYIALFAKPN